MRRCSVTLKVRYRHQDDALRGALPLARRGDRGQLNVYRCDRCHDWHVGHMPTNPNKIHRARGLSDVERADSPIADEPRCAFACRKRATVTVSTPRGEFLCCTRHAARMREVYGVKA